MRNNVQVMKIKYRSDNIIAVENEKRAMKEHSEKLYAKKQALTLYSKYSFYYIFAYLSIDYFYVQIKSNFDCVIYFCVT